MKHVPRRVAGHTQLLSGICGGERRKDRIMADKAYQQTGDYIPRTDAGFQAWLFNFSSLIQQDWNQYQLTEADSIVISGHYAAYNAIYQQCQQPSVRTISLLQQKDAVKASAMGSCRVYAQIIKNNQGVDNESKSALGLHIDDNTPSPIPVPSTAPMLAITGAFSGEHIIRYVDETTPTSRRKPHGVQFIEIYRNIASGPNPVESDAEPVGLFGKQPVNIPQDQVNTGLTSTYFGRWVNTKGEVGPWSLPIAMTIAFGGPVEQALPTGVTIQPEGGVSKAA